MSRGWGPVRPLVVAVGLLAVVAALVAVPVGLARRSAEGPAPASVSGSPDQLARAQAALGDLPLSFEANQGQDDASVAFSSRGAGYDLFLTSSEAVLALPGQAEAQAGGGDPTIPAGPASDGATLRMSLVGANPTPDIAGQEPLAGKVNYLRGSDPQQWQTGVPTFGQVAYDSVYPGVDLVYYGRGQDLEYDFVVAPGADPAPIGLRFSGADDMAIDAGGDLVLATPAGEVRQRRPEVYQDIDGARRPVAGDFVLGADGVVTFDLGAYDTAHPLVIDPVVTYSAYFGFAGFIIQAVDVDDEGNIYLGGAVADGGFSDDANIVEPFHQGDNATYDSFVAKLDPTATELIYATHLGSGEIEHESASAIHVDGAGTVSVAGSAALDAPAPDGFAPCAERISAYFASLNPDGTVAYATCIPGAGDIPALAVGADGSAYLTGSAREPFEPLAANGFLTAPIDGLEGYVVRIDPSERGDASFRYGTYFGGDGIDSGSGIAVDPTSPGTVWIAGQVRATGLATEGAFQPAPRNGDGCVGCPDAYVARINTDTQGPGGLEYATYYGGENGDSASAVAVGAQGFGEQGAVYIAGSTNSSDLSETGNGAQPRLGGGGDLFLAKISEQAGGEYAIDYATYLGGTGEDGSNAGLALGQGGDVYLAARTNSADLPVKNAFQPTFAGEFDLLVAQVDTAVDGAESLRYLSYLGGSGPEPANQLDLAADPDGNLVLGASTRSGDYQPTTVENGRFGEPGNLRSLLVRIPAQGAEPVFEVRGIDPPAGPAGVVVTISGSGFESATDIEVRFGATAVNDVTVVDDSTLTLNSPARGDGPLESEVTVTFDGGEPLSAGTFTYLEPTVDDVVVTRACGGLARTLDIAVTGTNLDLVEAVVVDGRDLAADDWSLVSPTRIDATFGSSTSGSSTVAVRTAGGLLVGAAEALVYEPCARAGGDEGPVDGNDPPPPFRPGGEGGNAPPFQTPGGSPGGSPGGGFTTAPGPANVPGGGFTTAPGSGGSPAGGLSPSGPGGPPAGGFSTAPGSSISSPGVAVPGVTPTPGTASSPTPGSMSPPPIPGAAPTPVAPVGGTAPPGAPALGSSGEETGGSGASHYSMVAADTARGVPPVAVGGAVLFLLFACALVVTTGAPGPGWRARCGTRSRPRPQIGY